ncbi:MAG: prenyltransferase/squalene oxidase repeat-containing protein [Verrucomicrobiota bacterium]|nr:prenyltransferase/squalene oxidase repeat-containing protein [Verrucomicrobiota bacterium]
MRLNNRFFFLLLFVVFFCVQQILPAANAIKPKLPLSLIFEAETSIKRAINFLISKQLPDGSWGDSECSKTSLCAMAIKQSPGQQDGKDINAVKRAAEYIVACQKKDGSIARKNLSTTTVYETAVSTVFLSSLEGESFHPSLKKATNFLLSVVKNKSFGSLTWRYSFYNRKSCKDSCTARLIKSWVIEALYLSRDLEKTSQDFFIKKTSQKTNSQDDCKIISYINLKNLLLLGIKRSDSRTINEYSILSRNYSIGKQTSGNIFKYYNLSKALLCYNSDIIIDQDSVPHNWRKELVLSIINSQNKEGAWNFRGESDLLNTSRAIIILELCAGYSIEFFDNLERNK